MLCPRDPLNADYMPPRRWETSSVTKRNSRRKLVGGFRVSGTLYRETAWHVKDRYGQMRFERLLESLSISYNCDVTHTPSCFPFAIHVKNCGYMKPNIAVGKVETHAIPRLLVICSDRTAASKGLLYRAWLAARRSEGSWRDVEHVHAAVTVSSSGSGTGEFYCLLYKLARYRNNWIA
jgi:hypothetical protein